MAPVVAVAPDVEMCGDMSVYVPIGHLYRYILLHSIQTLIASLAFHGNFGVQAVCQPHLPRSS